MHCRPSSVLGKGVAQGLSLALAVSSTGVTLITYALHGHVDWHVGIPMAIGGLMSVTWGVRLAHTFPEKPFVCFWCCVLR